MASKNPDFDSTQDPNLPGSSDAPANLSSGQNQPAAAPNSPGNQSAPTQPTAPATPGPDTHVVVTHDAVGPWPRGKVLLIDGLRAAGADLERLLRLGAVQRYDPANPQGAPLRSLAEAVRSESSPTLPNAPDTTATPEELAAAAAPNTFVTGPLPQQASTAPQQPETQLTHGDMVAKYDQAVASQSQAQPPAGAQEAPTP